METIFTLRGPMGLTIRDCNERLAGTRHERPSAQRTRKIKRIRDEMKDIRFIWRKWFAGA